MKPVIADAITFAGATISGWGIIAAQIAGTQDAMPTDAVSFSPGAIWVVGGLLASVGGAFGFAGRQLLAAKDDTASAIRKAKDELTVAKDAEINTLRTQLQLSQDREAKSRTQMIELLQTSLHDSEQASIRLTESIKVANAAHHAEHKTILEALSISTSTTAGLSRRTNKLIEDENERNR